MTQAFISAKANIREKDSAIYLFTQQLCSPLALFYLNKNNKLLPVAIQLKQKKGPDNPVSPLLSPKYSYYSMHWIKGLK